MSEKLCVYFRVVTFDVRKPCVIGIKQRTMPMESMKQMNVLRPLWVLISEYLIRF